MAPQHQRFQTVWKDEKNKIDKARKAEGVHRVMSGEHPEPPCVGLALSGGGIRSATFNLGVLQALARKDRLKEIDYLSTVSGGGYIGTWLSALKHRLPAGQSVEERLADPLGQSQAIQFLRDYSNYLTPKVGFFSADTFTGIATYVRNLLLNQFVLLCLIASVLLLPHFLVTLAAAMAVSGLPYWLIGAGMAAAASALLAGSTASSGEKAGGPGSAIASVALLMISAYALSVYALGSMTKVLAARHDPFPISLIVFPCIAYTLYWVVLARGFREHFDGTYSRVLGWAVLAGAAGGLLLWLVLRLFGALIGEENGAPLHWHTIGVGISMLPLIFALTAVVHIGLAKRHFTEMQREWWSRLGAWLLVMWLGSSLLFWTVAYALPVVLYGFKWVAGVAAPVWLAETVASVLLGKGPDTGEPGKVGWREVVTKLGPFVFVAGLVILLSASLGALLTALAAENGRQLLGVCLSSSCDLAALARTHFQATIAAGEQGYEYLLWILGLVGLGAFASWRVDINLFSLHSFYRNRLTRCYLGATNRDRHLSANRFTGFNPRDDLALAALIGGADGESVQRPYHLINTTLNLVDGSELAWQQRKAASFTFSPLYCGYKFPDTVSQPADAFAETIEYMRGPTLGTLMAVSGAAVSPSMGYHSSPAVTFLLTVFNVRLGRWCPNPRRDEAVPAVTPRFGWFYLLRELFGLTNARSKFVYLSDGGHFDNLGLYELVRRECRLIIVCDAGQDKDMCFEDLGNAIRKCRIDLGAEIDIDVADLRRDPTTGLSLSHFALGKVSYASGARGTIVYLKPSLLGDGVEPLDILQYKDAQPNFPHQTTLDQWFDEPQFESYRKLGLTIGLSTFTALDEQEVWPRQASVNRPTIDAGSRHTTNKRRQYLQRFADVSNNLNHQRGTLRRRPTSAHFRVNAHRTAAAPRRRGGAPRR